MVLEHLRNQFSFISSSILCSSPSRLLLETDNPRARAEVVDAEEMENTFEWAVLVVRVGVLRLVGRKCCWSCGRAGRGIVGAGANGAGRVEIYIRRVGRRLRGPEGGRTQPMFPLINLPPKLVSVLATPALLYRDAIGASSPERLPLLDLQGDAGPMADKS